MTSKPELASDANFAQGIGAVALFCVLAAAFVYTRFPSAAGFPSGPSITAAIGYALLDLTGQTPLLSNGFLAAFEIIDVALVAALVGAVTLARRDDAAPGSSGDRAASPLESKEGEA